MQPSPKPPSVPTLLLLATSEEWITATRVEASRLGWPPPLLTENPVEALMRLISGASFSHLLMEPAVGDRLLCELIAATAGCDDLAPFLVLIGAGAHGVHELAAPSRAVVVTRPEGNWLAEACAQRDSWLIPRAPLPFLEALPGLVRGQLHARYQPLVRIADGQVYALEALARLRHPHWGLLGAESFVTSIEDSGHAALLAEHILVRALGEWNGPRLAAYGLRLGINLPLDVLLAPTTLPLLLSLREQADIASDVLALELTETRPVSDPAALRPVLQTLRAEGFRLVIDDVGPHLRDHSVLLDLPFSSLKIDRSLVVASARRARARARLERITNEAHAAGMLVVAEGVEQPADWSRMAACGVDLAQGYLVARPLSAPTVPIWMDAWQRRVPALLS